MSTCPGFDIGRRNPKDVVDYILCPKCNYDLEFFLDDTTRKCPECRTLVSRDDANLIQKYQCMQWCSAAEDCMGTKLYSRLQDLKNKSNLEIVVNIL